MTPSRQVGTARQQVAGARWARRRRPWSGQERFHFIGRGPRAVLGPEPLPCPGLPVDRRRVGLRPPPGSARAWQSWPAGGRRRHARPSGRSSSRPRPGVSLEEPGGACRAPRRDEPTAAAAASGLPPEACVVATTGPLTGPLDAAPGGREAGWTALRATVRAASSCADGPFDHPRHLGGVSGRRLLRRGQEFQLREDRHAFPEVVVLNELAVLHAHDLCSPQLHRLVRRRHAGCRDARRG